MTVTLAKMASDNPALRQYPNAGRLPDGVLQRPAITANADPTKFDVSAFSYVIDGIVYKTAALTAQVFSAVHATGIAKWLGIGLYINRSGVVTTQGSPDTGDQDYATEALAIASIPKAPGGTVKFGEIRLLTQAADWDANTDSLTAADLAACNMHGTYVDRRWRSVKPGVNFAVLAAQTVARDVAGTLQAEVVATKQASSYNQVLTDPVLEVDRKTIADATVTKLRFGGFDAVIDGALYHFNAQDALAFTAAHKVTADKWGAILLLVSTAGVYSTLVGEATQTTAMAYTTAAAARAALPAVPAGKIAIGILVVEAGGADWDANTDDIVAGSDLEDFQLVPALPDRLLSDVTLAIDAVPEKFKISADFTVVHGGVKTTKAAATAIAFSAAHVCTASKYLAMLIGVTTAGVVSSRVPLIDGLSQTDTQGYDSYDEAIAALPTPLAGVQPIGAIVVLADAGGWTAQTDDMTPGSDLTNAWFVGFTTTRKLPFKASASLENTGRNILWPVSGAPFVANVQTDTAAVDNPRWRRGWASGSLAMFVAAKTDAAVTLPELVVVQRPWPAGGEATV